MARILLVDDDEALRTSTRLILTRFGHTVFEACDGSEGLKLFQTAKADVLILDIVMPEIGGLEFLMELRRKFPPIKTITISGGGRLTAAQYLRMTKLIGASRALKNRFQVKRC